MFLSQQERVKRSLAYVPVFSSSVCLFSAVFFLGCVLVLLGSSLVFVSLIGFLCSGWGSSICSFFRFLALVRLGCRSRSSGLGLSGLLVRGRWEGVYVRPKPVIP